MHLQISQMLQLMKPTQRIVLGGFGGSVKRIGQDRRREGKVLLWISLRPTNKPRPADMEGGRLGDGLCLHRNKSKDAVWEGSHGMVRGKRGLCGKALWSQ